MSAPIRLERETAASGSAGCATTIGVVVSGLGGVVLLAMRSEALRSGPNGWLVYVVGGGLSLIGLVMVILGIRMFAASRLPETILEVDRMPVRAGDAFQVIVRQPGPMRLTSLRLNLVGEQLTRRTGPRPRQTRIRTDRRLIHQHTVLDLGDLSILPGKEVARQATATVPADVILADIEGEKRVVWRLEVWGRVRGGVDFGHPFVIEVLGKATRPRERASS
jgi:hypothetical protein